MSSHSGGDFGEFSSVELSGDSNSAFMNGYFLDEFGLWKTLVE